MKELTSASPTKKRLDIRANKASIQNYFQKQRPKTGTLLGQKKRSAESESHDKGCQIEFAGGEGFEENPVAAQGQNPKTR